MAQIERACIAGAVIGAALGAAVGYLYGTEAGAHRRKELIRFVDRTALDVDDLRRAWGHLKDVWAQFEQDRANTPARTGTPRAWPPEGVA